MVAIHVNILFVLTQHVLDTNYGCLQALRAFLLMVQYMAGCTANSTDESLGTKVVT